jgi:3-deoxy-manno-octulosonate cytidylyltransferase (CMP-KDO synthetase)
MSSQSASAPAQKTPQVIGVIPARYAATRLPGKPLADIHGKPMVQWVWEAAKKARSLHRVIIATDDERILRAAESFGAEVLMTDPALPSGTDRVAAVAEKTQGDIYVNIQGDEPLMDPTTIDVAVGLVASGKFPMGTAMTPLKDRTELENIMVVKVLSDRNHRSIYFSRHPIPFSRGGVPEHPRDYICQRHLGLYTYTRDTLFRIRSLPPSKVEQGEVLEQLRALEDGIAIGIQSVECKSFGIDTPEDLERVRKLMN